jgi:TonB-dependent SusC/RagA subfamily outer membrane receptor
VSRPLGPIAVATLALTLVPPAAAHAQAPGPQAAEAPASPGGPAAPPATPDAAAPAAPSAEAPATVAPVTEAPVTEAPATEAPVTEASVTEASVTEASVTEAPAAALTLADAPRGAASGGAGAGLVLAGEELRRVPAQTLEEALLGRLGAAHSAASDATPGAGAALRLRGVPFTLSDAGPLYVVDGVPLGGRGLLPEGAGGGVEELNLYDIEQVELLPGPSAAALYGARGLGGVVRVTTRRGAEGGAPRGRVAQRVGVSQLSRKLGARSFASVDEAVATFGEGARAHFRPGSAFDHEALLASQQGAAVETLAEVAGGAGGTRWAASGLVQNQPGLLQGTGAGRQGLRLAVDQRLGTRVDVSATAHLLHGRTQPGLFGAGSSPYAVLAGTPSFVDLQAGADGSYPANPFTPQGANPLEAAARGRSEVDVLRAVAGLRVGATLWGEAGHQVTLGATGALDASRSAGEQLYPGELAFTPPGGTDATRLTTSGGRRSLEGGLELRHRFQAPGGGGALTLESVLGVQLGDHTSDTLHVVHREPSGPDGLSTSVAQARAHATSRAATLSTRALLLGERLQVDAGVRAEQLAVVSTGDAAGGTAGGDVQLAPLAGLSYHLPVGGGGEGEGRLVQEVRPWAAFGAVSAAAGMDLPDTFVPFPGEQVPAVRPERHTELALGVDVAGLDGRAVLGLRGYAQRVEDATALVLGGPGNPFGPTRRTLGTLASRGLEASLDVVPVRTAGLEWTSRVRLGLRRATVETLAVSALDVGGFGTRMGSVRLQAGHSPTQLVGSAGPLPNGTCCAVAPLGDLEPAFRMSLHNALRAGGFTLWALVDWQQGGAGVNLLRMLQDANRTSPDFTAAGAARLARFEAGHTDAYVEGTGFLKVREVALGYALPAGWYAPVLPGVRSVQLSLSARDLLTLTPWTGLEPEGGSWLLAPDLGPGAAFPSRSFWGALEVGF